MQSIFYLYVRKEEDGEDFMVGVFNTHYGANKYARKLMDNNEIVSFFIDERDARKILGGGWLM